MRTHLTRWTGAAALLGLVAVAAHAAPAPTSRPYIAQGTVIVFPFENNSMVGGKELADALSAEVKMGITATPGYSIATFYPQSPLLQRALATDKSLTRADVDAVVDPMKGTVDPTRAANVAGHMGGRYALLGSIEAAEVQANKADVTVTVQLLDTATGTPAKTAGVTGTAPATATTGPARDAALMAAAKDAARRALSELGFGAPTPPTAVPAREPARPRSEAKRSLNDYWVPIAALFGILIAGVK
jgi:hypothetical protein